MLRLSDSSFAPILNREKTLGTKLNIVLIMLVQDLLRQYVYTRPDWNHSEPNRTKLASVYMELFGTTLFVFTRDHSGTSLEWI